MQGVKLILREPVPSLGEAGDVVTVRPGFARNYLLPHGKAILATEGRVRELEHKRRVVAAKVAKERKAHEALRDRIQSLSLSVRARAGEEGKLFGSVTSAQIAELLSAQGVEVDRRRIALDEPIKELGEHAVEIRLQRDLVARLKLVVAPEEETG
jgi:large subunit ribosomal protein L9